MSDAPERVWIDEAGTVMHKGDSYVSIDGFTPAEYVRANLYDKQVRIVSDKYAALEKERNRLRAAIGDLAVRLAVSAGKVPLSNDPAYIRDTMETYANDLRAALTEEGGEGE